MKQQPNILKQAMKARREETIARACARAIELWTTTRMGASRVCKEAGISNLRLWKLVREDDLKRPPPPSPEEKRQRSEKGKKTFGRRYHFGSHMDAMDALKEANAKKRQQQRDLLVKLWNDGVEIEAIAVRTGLTEGQVRSRAKKLGLAKRLPRRTYQPSSPHHFFGAASAQRRGRAADWWRRT